MSGARSIVRSEQWWHHKVPPLVAVAAVAIGRRPGPADGTDLVLLALLLVSAVGVAAFGHIVNDWADITADAQGGKPNRMAALSRGRRVLLVVVTLVAGLVPWAFLGAPRIALVALAGELVLLLAYSLTPVRLKARGWAGALADAAYAYAVPFVMAATAVGPSTGFRSDIPPGFLTLLGLWGLVVGLRGILLHQVDDLAADRAAGVETVAARLGPSPTEGLVATYLVPVEMVLMVAVAVLSGVTWLPWVVGVFLVWRAFQMLLLWEPPLDPRTLGERVQLVRIVGFELVNHLLERWLPLAAVLALAWSSSWWWIAVAAVLLGFRNAVGDLLGHDIWAIPDALERLALSRGVRADIRALAARRTAYVEAGPAADTDHAQGRFVFVVCGPVSHLLTLRTAVHHLRPLAATEIWVLTDSTRNEHVIDIEGVDRVVDVATPTDLDHHQASIWLKTSVHRHLPPGEWCYLDSDIIAVAPGMEEVFSQRRGPVVFASDVTIRENSVDRFSPWAMTCACIGYDDQHSCDHLRQQLRARFGLDVPGDWLHWNGGVFAFGPDSGPFLDMWHERAVASFDWPEWKTRDQGALISTVWTLGLQDLPRLPPMFNFIADLGNGDLCLDVDDGWAHHPSGPWYQAKLLHLYTSPLEDPEWDLGADVEAVVVRRSGVRLYRYRRAELRAAASHKADDLRWRIQIRLELYAYRARRVPTRLTPARVWRAMRVRLGLAVSDLDIPPAREIEPQRSSGSAD